MARTDKRGRSLRAFLIAEIVGDDIPVEQVREAVGVKRSRWYGDREGSGRVDAEDFPNSEELRSVANYYGLGEDGWLNLLAEFGWLNPGQSYPGYTGGSPRSPLRTARERRTGRRPKPEVDRNTPPM